MPFPKNHKSWASNSAMGGKIVHEDEFEKMTISEKSFKQRKDDDFSRQETKKLAARFDIPLDSRYYPALFIIRNIKDTYTYSSFERDLEESSLEVDKFAVISEGHKNNYILYSVQTAEQAVKVYRGLSNRRLGGFGQTRVEYIEHIPILKSFREYTTHNVIKNSLGSFLKNHHHSPKDSYRNRGHDYSNKYDTQHGHSHYENDHRGYGRQDNDDNSSHNYENEHRGYGRQGYNDNRQYHHQRDKNEGSYNTYEKHHIRNHHSSNFSKQNFQNDDIYFASKPYKENKKQYDDKWNKNNINSDDFDKLQDNKTSGSKKKGEFYNNGTKNDRNERRGGKREYNDRPSHENKQQSIKETKIDKATSDLIAFRKKKVNDQKFGAKKKINKDPEFKDNNEWNYLTNN